MRRNTFYAALIFALMTAWAVAEESQDVQPQQQEPAVQDTKSPAQDVQPIAQDVQPAAQDVQPSKPVQPKLDEDGLYQIEKNIVEFTNRERERRGLHPLEIDTKLIDSARNQAKWMVKSRRLEHTRKPVGENIAMGYHTSSDVVRGWMNSSGHRANILNSGYRRIGVAAYKAKDGTVWWCQQFLR